MIKTMHTGKYHPKVFPLLRHNSFFFLIVTYLFGCMGSQLWQEGSLVTACGLLCCDSRAPQLRHANSQLQYVCGIQFPDQGLNPGLLHWQHGVLSTVSPGRSPDIILFNIFRCLVCFVTMLPVIFSSIHYKFKLILASTYRINICK